MFTLGDKFDKSCRALENCMVIVGSVVGFVAKNRQENRLLRKCYLAGSGAKKCGEGVLGGGRNFRERKNSKRNFRACERNYKGVIFLPVHIHAETPVSDLGFRCRDIDVIEACKTV